jgi:apoptosis-inducing factor 3
VTTEKRDFKDGVSFHDVPEGGLLAGQIGEDEVVLVRRGDTLFAIGAYCTHYHGTLADGLVVGDTVRCPLHHACFSLRTGRALRAPALDPIPCWRVERVGDRVFLREKLDGEVDGSAGPAGDNGAAAGVGTSVVSLPTTVPRSVVIVGGGAAGLAAADTLRQEGYTGPLTLISADDAPPCDRPNLSKDFLAGTAPDEWIPLRPAEYYADRRIDLLLSSPVSSIDTTGRRVKLANGRELEFDALLLATGADPVHLEIPGVSTAGEGQVHYLRSFADSRAIVAKASGAKRAVVVGGSFIGLEVAASLRNRGIEVHVVSRETVPMSHVLGPDVGRFVQSLHESHGVVFHPGATLARLVARQAVLSNGHTLDTVAERQGQVAARNILGRREKFDAVPFFWSQHYDVAINYVGHAEKWDVVEIEGSLATRDCSVSYKSGGRTLAVATIGRDLQSLRTELAMETG